MDSEIYGQWQFYQGRVREKKIVPEIWGLCWEAVDSVIFIVPGYGKEKTAKFDILQECNQKHREYL